jgi:hypothetical protein
MRKYYSKMNALNIVNDNFGQYRSRLKKRAEAFQYAKQTAKNEFFSHLKKIKSPTEKKERLRSILSLTNSSVWLSRSALKLLKSSMDLRFLENDNHNNSRAQEILACVTNGRTLEAKDSEVFDIIYRELTHSHLHHNSHSLLTVPQINVTIVLVSGVLNEYFSTPAFKRGAEKLFNQYNIKHLTPLVEGTKGSRENAAALKKQIDLYVQNNPDEKLWFFCFSKGGLDTLHYLKTEGEKLADNILGFSFVATPVLGSTHVNHRLLKIINALGKVPEHLTSQILGKKIDFLAKELQKSLCKNYRENWFKKNHKALPTRPFYTAIAFESKWHKSHIWMMLAKALFQSANPNDGVVDIENAQFPNYFKALNLGVIEGHHLVGSRSSFYDQEALLKAHLIFLRYKKLL